MVEEKLQLRGRIFIDMDIFAVTGLRIGGSPAALAIGDTTNTVIRDPLSQRPYIPGSSLRGKMRSLWEKVNGLKQNTPIGPQVRIHSLDKEKQDSIVDFEKDAVCRIFGVTGDFENIPNPTRLIVYDTFLDEASAENLERADTNLFTEIKWEAAIDRITSAAVPRPTERVPAGAIFSDSRLVFNLYGVKSEGLSADVELEWFMDLLQMLLLVEDDYLGSSGSRGSGRVRFENIRISLRRTDDYSTIHYIEELDDLSELNEKRFAILGNLKQALG